MPYRPKISAILPCFNHAKFLEERIQSILAQSHSVDQIVFLDDASTDGSVDIARKLLKEFNGQVDYFIRRTNSGSPFIQWNEGVRQAKHDLVWIAETDDSCDPHLIDTIYSAILSTESVLGYAQSRLIDEGGKILGSALSYTDWFWPDAFRRSFTMDGAQFNWHYMAGQNAIPNASAVLFRKDAYLSAGRANETMRFCGDWDVWIRICATGSVVFVPDELNYFRCHAATSRASGYTPYVAAEYFACRLLACIGHSTTTLSSLSPFDLINGFFDLRQRWQWKQAIQSLNLDYLAEARNCYQVLTNVPVLSEQIWLTLQILLVCGAIKNRATSLAFKFISIPSVIFRWFIKHIKTSF